MKYMTKAIKFSIAYIDKVMSINMTLADALLMFFILNGIFFIIIYGIL